MSVEALQEGRFTTQSDVWVGVLCSLLWTLPAAHPLPQAFGVTLWEIMSLAKTPWRKCSTQDVKKRVGLAETGRLARAS